MGSRLTSHLLLLSSVIIVNFRSRSLFCLLVGSSLGMFANLFLLVILDDQVGTKASGSRSLLGLLVFVWVVMLTLVLVLLPIVTTLTASATYVFALTLLTSAAHHATVVVLLMHFITKIVGLNYLVHDGHDRLLLRKVSCSPV